MHPEGAGKLPPVIRVILILRILIRDRSMSTAGWSSSVERFRAVFRAAASAAHRSSITMPIALTEQQRQQMIEKGFCVLPAFFQGAELQAIIEGMESCRGGRGAHAVSETVRSLIDHERVLSLVVDNCGWNIEVREVIWSVAQPNPGTTNPDRLAAGWHHDYEEEFMGVTHDGVMPLFDFKISFYLSDHTEPGHAATLVIPGSHLWTPQQRATWQQWVDPSDVVPIRVPAGSIMMWRSCLLHGVSPNVGGSVRKHLYVAYAPRWVRPTSPDASMLLDPAILAAASPIRRQLLGGMGDLSHPLGDNAEIGVGTSQHWFPTREEQVPLKQWAESRARPGEPMNWGTTGQGATWPPSFWRKHAGTDKADTVLNYLPKDSPAYKLFSGTKDSYFTGYTNFQNTTMQPAFERIPDWANQSNFAVPADGSSAAADGSPVSASGVASGEMSDAAVLRRVVPTLGETEAQNLLAANAGDLQASMKAALNLLAKL